MTACHFISDHSCVYRTGIEIQGPLERSRRVKVLVQCTTIYPKCLDNIQSQVVCILIFFTPAYPLEPSVPEAANTRVRSESRNPPDCRRSGSSSCYDDNECGKPTMNRQVRSGQVWDRVKDASGRISAANRKEASSSCPMAC